MLIQLQRILPADLVSSCGHDEAAYWIESEAPGGHSSLDKLWLTGPSPTWLTEQWQCCVINLKNTHTPINKNFTVIFSLLSVLMDLFIYSSAAKRKTTL